MVVWCTGETSYLESQCYTNFKISEGETVYLTHKDGITIVDSLKAKDIYEDESVGRVDINSDATAIYIEPTPYMSNYGAKQKILKPSFFQKPVFMKVVLSLLYLLKMVRLFITHLTEANQTKILLDTQDLYMLIAE